MNDFVTSLIRTYVPIVVGQFVAWLSLKGVELDPATVVSLTATVGGLLSALYYVVIRLLEKYVNPRLGVLLGSAKKPEYVEGDK